MQQIILGRRRCTGVQSEVRYRLQSFCFRRVLGLILLICMAIRLVILIFFQFSNIWGIFLGDKLGIVFFFFLRSISMKSALRNRMCQVTHS